MTKGSRSPPNAGKGRPPGVPNKVTRVLKEAILEAFANKGGPAYLEKIADNDPRAFCALLGRVLPLEVSGSTDGQPLVLQVISGVPANRRVSDDGEDVDEPAQPSPQQSTGLFCTDGDLPPDHPSRA